MQISALSQKTGVSLRSLRYYEEKGLITPIRKENGYREYSEADVKWVETIQLFLSIGTTTEEIARYFDCVATTENPELHSSLIIKFYQTKLLNVRKQIEFLQQAEHQIEDRLHHWMHKHEPMKDFDKDPPDQIEKVKHLLNEEVQGWNTPDKQ
ncbi:MerR family transcriptional regulator [Bacillus horti]|uniref:DNA-binding transcriptional MerR regulator n=1 Tax=Caldalkalibacillus horti TaxID=77523 RepID=A0ABT9VY12_9BACI|nr:MerR family transcriptional regulator [Bacillus horti]MDQ0165871.1 DNA-binding transcriptional MerR regulator [Bacillus horti]